MSRHWRSIGLAILGPTLLAMAGPSLADPDDARDTTFQMRNWRTFSIQRYPGDQAFEGGTVRFKGPEKGPYVERCHWTANFDVLNAPLGLTQRCVRHTLENTPE